MTNAAKIAALTPTTDINGREIKIGSLVRSFSAPLYTPDGDRLLGMNSEPNKADGNRVNFMDGIVEAIGTVTYEGCKRYTIRVIREVRTTHFDGQPTIAVPYDLRAKMALPSDHNIAGLAPNSEGINPPLNGTPSTMGRTFGVVVL